MKDQLSYTQRSTKNTHRCSQRSYWPSLGPCWSLRTSAQFFLHQTLRTLSPAPRHRGRSPEEGRKSHRRHSRRCTRSLCKASPEPQASQPPSQPLQVLGFLSARAIVSINAQTPLPALAATPGGGGSTSSEQCMICLNSVWEEKKIPLALNLITD